MNFPAYEPKIVEHSLEELYDAGAFTVANDYKELLNIIEKL